MKTYFIPHDSKIVILPTPDQVKKYLDDSDLWTPYQNQKNPDITGYSCKGKDGEGKEILILDNKFERFSHDPFYDDRFFGVISLMAAIEDLEEEEMIDRIKEHTSV